MNDFLPRLLGGRNSTQQYGDRKSEDFPRDVGGYGLLSARFGPLEHNRASLALVDEWIASEARDDVRAEILAVGLFYGAVLLATVPAARWRIGAENDPVVELRHGFGVAPLSVARRRFELGDPTLVENFDVMVASPNAGPQRLPN